MKKNHYKSILFLFIMLFNTIIAQTLTQEQKQKILANLANPPDSIYTENSSSDAIDDVKKYHLREAIPIIIQNIWKQEPSERLNYLWTLKYFKAPQTHDIAVRFIDSMDTFKFGSNIKRILFYDHPEIDRLNYKAIAAIVLIELGDYSKRQLIYDYISAINPKFSSNCTVILERIIKNFSKDELLAKNELIRIAQHHPENGARSTALLALEELYGGEMISLVTDRFTNDSDWTVRHTALAEILIKYRTDQVHNLLKARVLTDTNEFMKQEIADQLMLNYGAPNDYALMKQVYISLPDSSFSDIYPREYFLNEYIPGTVDSNATAKHLIDSLSVFQTQCKDLNWFGDSNFSSQLQSLVNDAKTKLNVGDSLGATLKIKQYQSAIDQARKDSLANRFVTEDGYKFLYYYPQYILDRLLKLPTVKLIDSHGQLINNGSLQYYDNSWKDAINNNDGTYTVPTTLKTVSLRMTYAFASKTKSNVTVGADTVVFQTIPVTVQLKNSSGNLMDAGTVQYYFNSWQTFGSTTNGVVTKELLPNNYTFRITYATATKDKTQDAGTNPTVVFQTVPATVQLKNSTGNFIDAGTVQYYFNSWQNFGSTTNGVIVKELLPNNYTFRMTHETIIKDIAQNISSNNVVLFSTVLCTVRVKNSQNQPVNNATVSYYFNTWKQIGITVNGEVTKELLPTNLTFRVVSGTVQRDKTQNISTNSIVEVGL